MIGNHSGPLDRTGSVWSASARIIAGVIGAGVLSVAWSVAQLGWIAAPVALLVFPCLTYYTSDLLASSYPSDDDGGDGDDRNRPISNYYYMDIVGANLGGMHSKLCGAAQYLYIFVSTVDYTVGAPVAIMSIRRSNCGHSSHCNSLSRFPYIIAFGVLQIALSQIPDFDRKSWLSFVTAIMSLTYSSIGVVLGIKTIAENGKIKGSLTGTSIGVVTEKQKIWTTFRAVGRIASTCSYSFILIETQDTLKSPPTGYETMKKVNLISTSVTAILFILCGCLGYAAFGDTSPTNLLTAFGSDNPYWLLDIVNVAILIHHIFAYQLYCQLLYAFIERSARGWYPDNDIINMEFVVPIPGLAHYRINLIMLITRSISVIITTLMSILMLSFFDDVVGILKAVGFWTLTVYFPVKMHIDREEIPKWSWRWIWLYVIVGGCLIISVAAAVGSLAALVSDVKDYKPFKIG